MVLVGCGQVSRQQELHSELLEEQAALRRQGAALRQQMEEAAGQLVALKAQYEKGAWRSSLYEYVPHAHSALVTMLVFADCY